jgi:RNA polymerase sigma-70 factor (ECF subfamily)
MSRDRTAFTAEDERAAGWIRDMAAGEVNSLKQLYHLYQRPLLAMLQALLQERGAAEEILQDVFVRAYEQAGRFDPALGTPFVWLATIGRRMAIDWLRRRSRRPEFVTGPTEQPAELADTVGSNEDFTVHQHLEAGLVRQRLGALPEAQRRAVELAFLHGFTHHEIAERLRRPLGSVKSDLRRGLLRLRKIYLGEDD